MDLPLCIVAETHNYNFPPLVVALYGSVAARCGGKISDSKSLKYDATAS